VPSDLGSQLLERESELGALETAIAVGTGGAGRVVVLEGATGVGKSALLDAARDMAPSRSLQVLSARGSELMRDVPFGVAVELFSERLKGPASVERDALFEGAAGLANSLFWPGTEREPAAAPDPTLPMVHGLYWLLVNLTERTPCLVVVDDAHWADEASLAFLVYLVERVDGLPVTVLIALRPEDAAMGGRPMARLRAVPTDRVLHLEPLSKDATTGLIRSRYFPDADEEFCGAVFDASRGNPFIAQELARTADLDGVAPVGASANYVRA
jgi:predicted ATPase